MHGRCARPTAHARQYERGELPVAPCTDEQSHRDHGDGNPGVLPSRRRCAVGRVPIRDLGRRSSLRRSHLLHSACPARGRTLFGPEMVGPTEKTSLTGAGLAAADANPTSGGWRCVHLTTSADRVGSGRADGHPGARLPSAGPSVVHGSPPRLCARTPGSLRFLVATMGTWEDPTISIAPG